MKKRCGWKTIDKSGRRFGSLVVSSEWETRKSLSGKKRAYWLCRCDCGRDVWVESNALRRWGTKSCGCKKGSRIETGMASRNRVFRRYKMDAKKKNREFRLSVEDFTKISMDKCFYCGCDPSTIQKAEGDNGDWFKRHKISEKLSW